MRRRSRAGPAGCGGVRPSAVALAGIMALVAAGVGGVGASAQEVALPPAGGGGSLPTSAALRAADSLVASWVAEERIPGAVLLVARDGERLLHRAYGWAQLYEYGAGQYTDAEGIVRRAHPRPMTTETVFDLASVTKVMATTLAVMLLVDEGVLDVDAPVRRYLPDFSGGGKEEITLRHLLTHRAGLYPWQPTYYHASNAEEVYRYILRLPLRWSVGAERHYSDLGFMLLGRVVEKAAGMPLDYVLADRLYRALGLHHTGFRPRAGAMSAARPADGGFAATSHGNPFEYRMVHDSTFGYRYTGDPDRWNGWRRRTLAGEVNDGNAYHAFGGVAGHAGLFSTAADLERLLRLMVDLGEVDGRRILRRQTVEAFLTDQGDHQALGWQLPGYAPPGSFGHTGFTGTFVLGVPSRKMVVILLTNRQNLGVNAETRYPDVGPLQEGVTRLLLNP